MHLNEVTKEAQDKIGPRTDKRPTLFPIKVPDKDVGQSASKAFPNVPMSRFEEGRGMPSKQPLKHSYVGEQEHLRSSAAPPAQLQRMPENPNAAGRRRSPEVARQNLPPSQGIEQDAEHFFYEQEPSVRPRSALRPSKVKTQLHDYRESSNVIESEANFNRQGRTEPQQMHPRRDYSSDTYPVPGSELPQRRAADRMLHGVHHQRAALIEEANRMPPESSGESNVMPQQRVRQRQPPETRQIPSRPPVQSYDDRKHIARQHIGEELEERNQIPGLESTWEHNVEADNEKQGRPSRPWQDQSSTQEQFDRQPRYQTPRRYRHEDHQQHFESESWAGSSEYSRVSAEMSMASSQDTDQKQMYKDEGEGNRPMYNKRPMERSWPTETGNVPSRPLDRTGSQKPAQTLPEASPSVGAVNHRQAPDTGRDLGGLFQAIVRVRPEDISKGMYFCGVCKIFIASETERTMHALTEDHKEALKARNSRMALQKQAAPPQRSQALLSSLAPQSGPRDMNQFRPRAPRPLGGRGQPMPAYGTQGRYPRPRGGMPPRYSGPP